MTLLNPGKVICYENNKYEIREKLGSGGFGTVYKAKLINTGGLYAVKVLEIEKIKSNRVADRVNKEILIQRQLNHPSIIKLYDYFQDEDNIYIVLELCVEDLEAYRKRFKNNQIDEAKAKKIIYEIANGMLHLKNNGLMHRDLKLSNILIDFDDKIKIADFGLAKLVTYEKPYMLQGRRTEDTICGTAGYMSPEVATGSSQDNQVDVWALGCILYTLLVGTTPYETKGIAPRETMTNIVATDYKIPGCVSVEAADLIRKCLLKNPKDRITIEKVFGHPFLNLSSNNEITQRTDSGVDISCGSRTHSYMTSYTPVCGDQFQGRNINVPPLIRKPMGPISGPKGYALKDIENKCQESNRGRYNHPSVPIYSNKRATSSDRGKSSFPLYSEKEVQHNYNNKTADKYISDVGSSYRSDNSYGRSPSFGDLRIYAQGNYVGNIKSSSEDIYCSKPKCNFVEEKICKNSLINEQYIGGDHNKDYQSRNHSSVLAKNFVTDTENSAIKYVSKHISLKSQGSPSKSTKTCHDKKEKSDSKKTLEYYCQPLTTRGIQPKRYKAKNAILHILHDGYVCIEDIVKAGDEERVTCAYRISPDGLFITIYCPKNEEAMVTDEPLKLPTGGTDQLYPFNKLPRKYFSKYLYAARYVDMLKAHTAKVTYFSDEAKCILMENGPNADFEAVFYSGETVTLGKKEIKVCDSRGKPASVRPVQKEDRDEIEQSCMKELDEKNRKKFDHARKIRNHCRKIEELLTNLESGDDRPNFPVVIGKRQFGKKLPSSLTSYSCPDSNSPNRPSHLNKENILPNSHTSTKLGRNSTKFDQYEAVNEVSSRSLNNQLRNITNSATSLTGRGIETGAPVEMIHREGSIYKIKDSDGAIAFFNESENFKIIKYIDKYGKSLPIDGNHLNSCSMLNKSNKLLQRVLEYASAVEAESKINSLGYARQTYGLYSHL